MKTKPQSQYGVLKDNLKDTYHYSITRLSVPPTAMPPTAWSLTDALFIDLLSSVARRPSRHCVHQRLLVCAPSSRRHASSSNPDAPKQPSRVSGQNQPSVPSSVSTKPSPVPTAIAPGSHVPLRMLLDRNPENRSAISKIPIPAGERGESFTPQPLSRPLGLPYAPQPGQNSPVDLRTLAEKKADFSSYEKAMERRRLLLRGFLRPYFQERKRMDHHQGKSFVSNERLFRGDKALWFPNLWGRTLRKEGDGIYGGMDTTGVLRGRVSVVGVQSGVWAENQVKSFLGKENEELQALVGESGGVVQRVDINIQADWVKSLLVRLFKGRLRKMMEESQWGRYFMVKLAKDVGKGLTEDVRDAMGLLNSQVGYVYLLDTECRIRWAGSGNAWPGEVEGLNRGVRRLIEEANQVQDVRVERTSPVRKEKKAQARGFWEGNTVQAVA